jgi:hypothetical protein
VYTWVLLYTTCVHGLRPFSFIYELILPIKNIYIVVFAHEKKCEDLKTEISVDT